MKRRISLFADVLTSEQEFSERATKLLSIAFLLISASLCFRTYQQPTFLWKSKELSIRPELVSGAIAIMMLVPLYARGVLRWSKSIYGIIILILLWVIYAALIQVAIGGGKVVKISQYLIASAALLSWLGMRSAAGLSWILAFAACIYSIIQKGAALEIYGFILLASAFLGCLLHSGLGPKDFMREITDEFHLKSQSVSRRISDDVSAAGNAAGKII